MQEIWVEDDFLRIEEAVKPYLKHSRFFFAGMISGPGLAVFSRWPIVETWLFPFPLNGRPSAFFRGDWYVGKSASSTLIRHPSGLTIDMLNAHFHAPYGSGDAAYICHRTSQAWAMARIAHTSSIAGYLPIIVGDMNSVPSSLAYRLMTTRAPMADSWFEKYGTRHYSKEEIRNMPPQEQIEKAGTTCDSLLNTWRQKKKPEDAKRLDYILFDKTKAAVVDARVSFTENLQGIGSYSDHFAIEADLRILHPTRRTSLLTDIPPCLEDKSVHEEGIMHAGNLHDENLKQQVELLDQVLQLIQDYRPTYLWQKYTRLTHFWVSTGVWIGMLISVWWGAAQGRTYVAFIYMLVGSLILVSGVIDGLIGFLFGGYEHRALREFQAQVALARRDCLGL